MIRIIQGLRQQDFLRRHKMTQRSTQTWTGVNLRFLRGETERSEVQASARTRVCPREVRLKQWSSARKHSERVWRKARKVWTRIEREVYPRLKHRNAEACVQTQWWSLRDRAKFENWILAESLRIRTKV